MPLTRADKEQLLAEYEQGLKTAPHAFVLGYQGIKVPQVTALREKVRQSGGQYIVVKNTLALRAIDGAGLAPLREQFVGPTAVVFTDGDPVSLAKALTDFAKDVPAIQFKGGMVEGRAIAADQIKDIAALPSREALIAKLLFLLPSPIPRFGPAATSCSPGCSSGCSRPSRASRACWPRCRSRSCWFWIRSASRRMLAVLETLELEMLAGRRKQRESRRPEGPGAIRGDSSHQEKSRTSESAG